MQSDDKKIAYWKTNLRYLTYLLGVWFLVSYVFGILLVEPLNAITIPLTSFPAGFWFAQQGSIYIFVALIVIYVKLMNKLDEEYDVHE